MDLNARRLFQISENDKRYSYLRFSGLAHKQRRNFAAAIPIGIMFRRIASFAPAVVQTSDRPDAHQYVGHAPLRRIKKLLNLTVNPWWQYRRHFSCVLY